jgi:hypothetical protein
MLASTLQGHRRDSAFLDLEQNACCKCFQAARYKALSYYALASPALSA